MTSANTRKPQGQAESASKPQPPSQHAVKGQKHSNTKKQPTTIQYDDKKARARDTKRKVWSFVLHKSNTKSKVDC